MTWRSTEKVKIYDKGISMNHDPERRERMLAGYRNGAEQRWRRTWTPAEALRLMAREFVNAIAEKRAPISDGHAGLPCCPGSSKRPNSPWSGNGRPIETAHSPDAIRERGSPRYPKSAPRSRRLA